MVRVSDTGAVGIMDLMDIREQLAERNVIAFLSPVRYAVNCVRTAHHEHVTFATCNGKIIEGSERVFVGVESFPREIEIFRLQRLYNVGIWEKE